MQLTGEAKKNWYRATLVGLAVTIAWLLLSFIFLYATLPRVLYDILGSLGFVLAGMTTGLLVRGGWRSSFWHSAAAAVSIAIVVTILSVATVVLFVVFLAPISIDWMSAMTSVASTGTFPLVGLIFLYLLIFVFLGGVLGSAIRIFRNKRAEPSLHP